MEERKESGWALPIAIVAVTWIVCDWIGIESGVVYMIVVVVVLLLVRSLGGYR